MLSSLFNMKGYLPFSLAALERVAVAVAVQLLVHKPELRDQETLSTPRLLARALVYIRGTHFEGFPFGPYSLVCSMQEEAHATWASGTLPTPRSISPFTSGS